MADQDLIINAVTVHRSSFRVEVAKSFSYKLDMKRYDPWYENRDFFCSVKTECDIAEADAMADRLYLFCRRSVVRDLKAYLREFREQQRRDQQRQKEMTENAA